MKKQLSILVLCLASVFSTANAQTVEELGINKNGPEFKITYPSGHIAYVDAHKLYPPEGKPTVGFYADFDPLLTGKFKKNAETFQWNTGKVAGAFKAHVATHANQLGTTPEEMFASIDNVHKKSLVLLNQ